MNPKPIKEYQGLEVKARFWLLALDVVFWLGFNQGSQVYLWVLSRASDAMEWSEPEWKSP